MVGVTRKTSTASNQSLLVLGVKPVVKNLLLLEQADELRILELVSEALDLQLF